MSDARINEEALKTEIDELNSRLEVFSEKIVKTDIVEKDEKKLLTLVSSIKEGIREFEQKQSSFEIVSIDKAHQQLSKIRQDYHTQLQTLLTPIAAMTMQNPDKVTAEKQNLRDLLKAELTSLQQVILSHKSTPAKSPEKKDQSPPRVEQKDVKKLSIDEKKPPEKQAVKVERKVLTAAQAFEESFPEKVRSFQARINTLDTPLREYKGGYVNEAKSLLEKISVISTNLTHLNTEFNGKYQRTKNEPMAEKENRIYISEKLQTLTSQLDEAINNSINKQISKGGFLGKKITINDTKDPLKKILNDALPKGPVVKLRV